LITHPGAGRITALATKVVLGEPFRFANSKELASYVGMIPGEYSSGDRQRLGDLSKQDNPLLRFLWGEAGIHVVRRDPELKRFFRRKTIQEGLTEEDSETKYASVFDRVADPSVPQKKTSSAKIPRQPIPGCHWYSTEKGWLG
jgi:transposase